MRNNLSTLLLLTFISGSLSAVTWVSPTNNATLTASESDKTGTVIATLSTTSTNTVTYTDVSETPATDRFGIRNTNELYLKNTLDYETTTSYAVVLRAIDTAASESSDITVKIEVVDANDEPPVITSPSTTTLLTNTAQGTVVYKITSTDRDTVGTVTYAINSGNENGDFILNSTTGEITLNATLDIADKRYDLVVEANDGNSTVTKTVIFYLSNVFWQTPTEGQMESIAENTTTGTVLLNMNADNALVYNFDVDPESEKDKFSTSSGQLILENPLDYETTKSYTFTLSAAGSKGTSERVYIINVTDINDVAPEFVGGSTVTLDLSKETDIASVVHTAQATDDDTVGTIAYSISGGNTNSDFSINATSGEVTLEKNLNPDTTATYSLVIEATDSVATASQTLSIIVNRIVWTDPTKGTSSDIAEDTAVNKIIKNLTAETATTYTIQSQSPNTNTFGIVNTDELVLLKSLDYESVRDYSIVLRAIDSTGKVADNKYNLNVTDVNDVVPQFVSGTSETIAENTPAGTSIHKASANDADTVGSLTYSITAGNNAGVFAINSTTGEITLAREYTVNDTSDLSASLSLEADDGINKDTQSLTIYFKSVPALNLGPKTIMENVNTTGGYDVLTLTSTDVDNDPNPTYSIIAQSHPGTFSINADKTKVITTASFDREQVDQYNFTIRVQDSSQFELTSEETVVVTIQDVNDVAPNITSVSYIELADDTVANSMKFVYSAKAEDPDIEGSVTFSITDGNTNNDFEIQANGSLYLNNALNGSATASYNLTITANDTVNTTPFILNVRVITEPMIAFPANNVTLDEGTYTNHIVWTLTSTDVDNDPNPTFEIVSQEVDGTFTLNGTNLITSATFDFENKTTYEVTLNVTDSSTLRRSSTATLTVHITDVNDEPPVFAAKSVALELREDTPLGLVDYTAATTDADSTSAEYTIIGGDNNDVFSINSTSGKLSLATPLTNFTDLGYNVIIQANDSVNVATQQVNISVVTAPKFVFPSKVEIAEGSYAGSEKTVLVLNSTDRDGDTNPSYELVSQDPAGIFSLSADNSSLVTTAVFDYETIKSYNVTLKVVDTSTFQMSSIETLTIDVTDVNDNAPVFVSGVYFEVSEFEVQNAVVYIANTTDVDTESTVTYDIIDGNTDNIFGINATSGEITLVGSLQPNVTLRYLLTLQANDSVQTTNFNVTVQVKTAPRFVLPTANLTIPEDTDASGGLLVWTIVTNDLDGDTGVQNEIVSQSGNNTFVVDGNNLTTTATFDFETAQMFTVTLSATDNSTFALSSNATLVIYITDANDNVPVFTSQGSVDMPEFKEVGSEVIEITSTDNDTVGTTTYSILDGNSEGFFSLDSTSGNLTLVKSFDPDGTLTFNLTIQANDTVNVVSTNLLVNVVTVPRIEPILINITENNVAGEFVVWGLTASDKDNNTNPTFALVAQSDPGVFEINVNATAVVTNATFDYETKINYTFVINVTDSSSLGLSSSATFTVSILDENDNFPNFTSASVTDVLETTATNTSIYTAVTSDPDTIGTTTYAIKGGNDAGIFEIDAVSGVITLNKSLNATEAISHVLLLEANDTVNAATYNVTFKVRTAPRMIIPDMVTVTENAADGTVVLTLASEDLDGDNNPVYELVSISLPGALRLNENNTQLLVNTSIDYETDKNFTVVVRVTEISDLNLTSTSEFTVYVLDANDKSPVFTSDNTTEMAENTLVNETIYTAVAVDEDTMGNITYSIIGGNTGNVFAIDAESGNLTLQTAINPTTAAELTYNLVLAANDSINTETLNLTVLVKTAPVIHVEDIYIPENINTTGGYVVWQINYTDIDGDEDPTFKIVDQPGVLFKIYGSTIYTNNNTIVEFDFEVTKNYTISFNATDNSTFKLSSTATITIIITDLNDNNPSLTSNTSLVVLETANIDETLYVATANDVDTVGTLSFEITDGNRNNDFAINASTGDLTLQNKLNPQNTSDILYNLVIQVNDTLNTDSLNLTVNVKTAPRLNISDQTIDENTNTTKLYEVWNIIWSDIDGDLNPRIEVVAESLPGSFQVINDSVLVTNASFDFESLRNLTVTLSITDVHGLSSNDTFTLYVRDVNDVTPAFTSNSTIDVSEETVNGTIIYTASTVDADTSPTPTVEYSITDGNAGGFFSINANTGELVLDKMFDDNSDLQYTLTLQANDSLNVGLFNLTINVITVPVIIGYQINITENNDISDVIWNLTSSDRDNDTDPVYVIANQSDADVFVINGAKTAVIANISFDFESKTLYTFEIVVTDTSSLKLSSSVTFTVSIIDVNDNYPVVTSNATVQLEEDTANGTVIYTLTADDNDTVGSLEFDIIRGNDAGLFSINRINGSITLESALNATATLTHLLTLQVNDSVNVVEFNLTIAISTAPVMIIPDEVTVVENVDEGTQVMFLNSSDLDGDTNPVYRISAQSTMYGFKLDDNNTYLVTNSSIDYESLKNYSITIEVTDTSKFMKSSSTEFTVTVVDANDNSPVFTSNNSVNITQFTANGTVIYNATSEDVDTVGSTTYSLIGGDPNSVFSIGSENGGLTLESVLNPTTVDDVTYNLVLQANDSVNTATFNLTVNVKTAPIINVVDIEIPEDVNTTSSYTVWSINSTDLDGEENPSFEIVSQSDPGTFEINSNNDVITTNTSFDFETTKNYTVVIRATDGSGLSSTATLNIIITDVNDVVPKITSNTSFIVLETAAIEEVLYTLTSEDIDTVGTVTYFIADGNRNNDFTINATSGVLTLQNKLQPNNVSDLVYDLTLGANDTVNVAYLNVQANVKTVPYLNLTDVNVAENTDTSSGYYDLLTLNWNDLDGDINPTFDIVQESKAGTFQIENGTLKTNATLDYEVETNYTAIISITDVHGLTSNGTFTLNVVDENDVKPVFTNNVTIINVWEKETPGLVYTLAATDPDTVGEIQYSIVGGNGESKFSLDSSSGNLSLTAGLDFATTELYTIQMMANDSENAAYFNLTINVKTSPVINFTGVNVEISEGDDTSNSFVVFNLTSTDADNDINPTYDIIQQDQAVFFIVGDQLKTNRTFDRETLDHYSVNIRVTDSSLGLTSNDTLTVTITDVNDNAPNIVYPTTATIEVREDTPTGSLVFVTSAFDVDKVGELSYSLIDGNTGNDFSIDASVGNVTLSNPLNATETINYNLTISVNDTVFETTVTVPITVKTAPLMAFPAENVTIAEGTNTSGQYPVLTLTSTDLDNDPNPKYEILNQSSSGTFFISNDNTALLTTASFNYSDVKMYEVTIQVTDSSQFNMSSTATLTIYVTDTNNLAPEFTMEVYTLELPENQPTGVSLYQAVAIDRDTVGQVSYSISAGNTNEDFAIDADSGNLTLVNALVPATTIQYILTIQANDTINTATQTVTVNVKTIPEIVVPGEPLTILETMDTSGTYVVHELTFTDLDNDTNPTFSILSQTVNDTFELTNDTKITTTAKFDYETRNTYEIVILITETSSFNFSSSATFTVSIVNADDEPPVFTSANKKYVPESQALRSIVYTIETYDNDTSDGITYSILGGNTNNDFSVNAASGAITLAKELRPRDVLVYTLTLQANDSINQAQFNLTINVVTAPELTFPNKIEIDENSDTSGGTLIWIAQSSDLDGDSSPEYRIVSQSVNDTFVFDDDYKRLKTFAKFDYEETKFYEVAISVTDNSPLNMSSTSTLTVTILDLNDVTPNITSPLYVKILENTDNGTVIFNVTSEDPDTIGTVSYQIIGGNTNNDFSIDASSGSITLVNTLNVTAVANYSLEIRANDTLNVVDFTLVIDLKPDIDECASNPCQNDATCVDGVDEFTCNCVPGYNGDACENDIDECASEPCQNNGTCTQFLNGYNCTCAAGFEGVNCENDTDECLSSPCQNGTCNDLVNGYNCSCVAGYTGVNCDQDINECSSDPCQNNATCTDAINGYVCACLPGYDGDNCQNDIDECAAVTCSNNGTCNDLINGYNCTCPPGFTGTLCGQDVDECASNPCQNHVTCVNNVNSYKCICKDGYNGTNCETDIDECASNPCENGGNCTDKVNSFTCSCAAGYEGETCANECTNNRYGPNCNQECACNANGTVSCNHVNGSCTCNDFYTGNTCNDDVNECLNDTICNKTNEGCDNIIGGYACSCLIGYERNNDTNECDQVTATTTTTAVPATQTVTKVSISFDITLGESVDLNVQSTYNRYKTEVTTQLRIKYISKLGTSSFIIVIRSMRKGSLEVDYDVITNKEDAAKVAEANVDLATDTAGITIFNETAVPSKMTVNEKTVPVQTENTDAVKCQVYEATIGACTGDFICDVKDGKAGCVRKEDGDNLALILGLGIGIPSIFLALAAIILCVAYYNNKTKFLRRKHRRDDFDDRSNEMYERKLPVRANTGPPTWPFLASPEYAEYGPYSDYSREGGQRYLPSEDFQGQYDNRVAQDRDSNNYTWDYLFTHIRPGEQYQIRRPKVDYK